VAVALIKAKMKGRSLHFVVVVFTCMKKLQMDAQWMLTFFSIIQPTILYIILYTCRVAITRKRETIKICSTFKSPKRQVQPLNYH
jgi:hypothetical protein